MHNTLNAKKERRSNVWLLCRRGTRPTCCLAWLPDLLCRYTHFQAISRHCQHKRTNASAGDTVIFSVRAFLRLARHSAWARTLHTSIISTTAIVATMTLTATARTKPVVTAHGVCHPSKLFKLPALPTCNCSIRAILQ